MDVLRFTNDPLYTYNRFSDNDFMLLMIYSIFHLNIIKMYKTMLKSLGKQICSNYLFQLSDNNKIRKSRFLRKFTEREVTLIQFHNTDQVVTIKAGSAMFWTHIADSYIEMKTLQFIVTKVCIFTINSMFSKHRMLTENVLDN